MCTDDVKIALFKAYCTPLYTTHLWCRYSKSKYNKLRVAYNDALRILLRLPRCTSASQLFVNSGVPTLNALLRNLIDSFMMRLMDSKNEIIMTLTMPKLSSIRYTSSLWKHWRECLYVFQLCFLFVCCCFVSCIVVYMDLQSEIKMNNILLCYCLVGKGEMLN